MFVRITTDPLPRPNSLNDLGVTSDSNPLVSLNEFSYKKGNEIYGEKEPAEYVYQVKSGAVRSYKLLSDGRRQIGAFHLAGDIFGLENGAAHRFTAPVRDASSFRPIAAHDYLPRWPSLHALLAQAYRRAPQWRAIEPLVHAVLDDPDDNVARKNARSIRLVFDYLGVAGPRWSLASALDPEPTLRAQERVLALCAATGATTYVNSPGGRALYSGDDFAAHGVALRFLQMLPIAYDQGTPEFVANLSMLDVLAHCPRDEVVALLDRFELDT